MAKISTLSPVTDEGSHLSVTELTKDREDLYSVVY